MRLRLICGRARKASPPRKRYSTRRHMHHIYHTEAIVLSARAVGEADRLLSCYTRELGLIRARARGVRNLRSKLRYALVPLAIIEADFVEARGGWRLTSARPGIPWRTLLRERGKRTVAAGVANLLSRLVHGEERNEALFLDIREGLLFIDRLNDPDALRDAEILLVLRLLAALGYWGEREEARQFLRAGIWSELPLAAAGQMRRTLLAEINRALKETQL